MKFVNILRVELESKETVERARGAQFCLGGIAGVGSIKRISFFVFRNTLAKFFYVRDD